MATAFTWTANDYAAKEVLADLISNAGYSYRQFEQVSGNEINYNRVRDIALGRRAPVKLSEFLLICDVCDADPVQVLRRIISEARRIEARNRTEPSQAPAPANDAGSLADRIAAHPEEFGLMASTDPDKENEMNTPRE